MLEEFRLGDLFGLEMYHLNKFLPGKIKLYEIVCSCRAGLQAVGWLCHKYKVLRKEEAYLACGFCGGFFFSYLVIDSRLLSWMMISGASLLEYLKGAFKLLWENY